MQIFHQYRQIASAKVHWKYEDYHDPEYKTYFEKSILIDPDLSEAGKITDQFFSVLLISLTQ